MDAIATYALRLGDDSLILGQRLSEWCGHAPVIEVDLSLTNVALDQIVQATHLHNLLPQPPLLKARLLYMRRLP